jgi:hypothetical protein
MLLRSGLIEHVGLGLGHDDLAGRNPRIGGDRDSLDNSARADKHAVAQAGIEHHRPEPDETALADLRGPMHDRPMRNRRTAPDDHPCALKRMDEHAVLHVAFFANQDRLNQAVLISFIGAYHGGRSDECVRRNLDVTDEYCRRIDETACGNDRPVTYRVCP